MFISATIVIIEKAEEAFSRSSFSRILDGQLKLSLLPPVVTPEINLRLFKDSFFGKLDKCLCDAVG